MGTGVENQGCNGYISLRKRDKLSIGPVYSFAFRIYQRMVEKQTRELNQNRKLQVSGTGTSRSDFVKVVSICSCSA